MKKPILIVFLLLLTTSVFAQKQAVKNTIDADKLSEKQLVNLSENAPKDGWVLLKYQGENHVVNYSNKEYVLYMHLKCSKANVNPSYLVEFTNHYGDKQMGGIDFISSRENNYPKIDFSLDGKHFGNPFVKVKSKSFTAFTDALKLAKVLKIEVYTEELNPETGKDELKLIRTVDFKLAHPEILDSAVKCD